MEMEEEARNIIKDHKNPLTKVNLIGTKLFLDTPTQEVLDLVSKNLNNLENSLRHQKVERRCARAKAQWLPTLKLAKVLKVVKGLLEHFGYQDKTGTYMYPEEMLFLMETNRLEVLLNDVPLSIQEGYDIVLNLADFDLTKYRVYKKLVLQGNRVIRCSEIARRKATKKYVQTENNDSNIKRTLEQPEDRAKKRRYFFEEKNNEKLEQKRKEMEELFEELRKIGTQPYVPQQKEVASPDYCLFFPQNNSRVSWDYNLYICKTFALDEIKSDFPSMYAVCSGDNISFFKIGSVNLPVLGF